MFTCRNLHHTTVERLNCAFSLVAVLAELGATVRRVAPAFRRQNLTTLARVDRTSDIEPLPRVWLRFVNVKASFLR
jgi:hypothetical protein